MGCQETKSTSINELEERLDLLLSIDNRMKKLENLILSLNKRNIEFKMKQLFFLMETINLIKHCVKFIEDQIEFKYSGIKSLFLDVLNAIEGLNKTESERLISVLYKELGLKKSIPSSERKSAPANSSSLISLSSLNSLQNDLQINKTTINTSRTNQSAAPKASEQHRHTVSGARKDNAINL